MKILKATKETQGKRKNDFSWTTPNEVVTFCMECDGEKVDGHCGCRRSMVGITSHKATTTMRVVNEQITADEYTKLIGNESFAKELLRIAGYFPVGAVIEKRGNKFNCRAA